MKYCPKCSLELPETAKFCKSCGGALVEKSSAEPPGARCPSCGAAVQAGWKFCKKCAARLTTDLSAAGAAVPMIVCAHCSVANREGMRFCKSRGKPLGVVSAAAPALTAEAAGLAPAPSVAQPSRAVDASVGQSAGLRPAATGAVPRPALAETRPRGVVCPKCGAQVAAGLKFCEKCGEYFHTWTTATGSIVQTLCACSRSLLSSSFRSARAQARIQ